MSARGQITNPRGVGHQFRGLAAPGDIARAAAGR